MTVALHRVQNLNAAADRFRGKEHLSQAVSTYRDFEQRQFDAQEDEEFGLASSIGRQMRLVREQFPAEVWERAISA